MEYREEVHAELTARYYVYELFQILFGNDPRESLFESIDVEFTEEALSLVLPSGEAKPEILDFVQGLRAYQEQLPLLQSDFTNAFVGPHELPAPPWESVYSSGKRLLLQVSTLEIREIYRSQGLLPEMYPRVADDHVALELDFMARLAVRMQDAYVSQDRETFLEAQEASSSFLKDHLLQWISSFAADLAKWKQDSWYTATARALEDFLKEDARKLTCFEVS